MDVYYWFKKITERCASSENKLFELYELVAIYVGELYDYLPFTYTKVLEMDITDYFLCSALPAIGETQIMDCKVSK